MCVGNGFNDMAMFRQAIDDEMIAAIMEDATEGLIDEIQKYKKEKGKEKGNVTIIPNDKDKANQWIHRMAKVMESKMNYKAPNYVKRNTRLPDVQRVKVEVVRTKKRKTIPSRKGYKER